MAGSCRHIVHMLHAPHTHPKKCKYIHEVMGLLPLWHVQKAHDETSPFLCGRTFWLVDGHFGLGPKYLVCREQWCHNLCERDSNISFQFPSFPNHWVFAMLLKKCSVGGFSSPLVHLKHAYHAKMRH